MNKEIAKLQMTGIILIVIIFAYVFLHITNVQATIDIATTKYRVIDEYIMGVLPGEKVETFLKNVSTNDNKECMVYHGKETVENDMELCTGMILKVGEDKEYKIVVAGDVDGNGKLSAIDLSQGLKNIVEEIKLEEVYERALDLNFDREKTVLDISLLKMLIVGFALRTDKIEIEGPIIIHASTTELAQSVIVKVTWPEEIKGLTRAISIDGGRTYTSEIDEIEVNENNIVIARLTDEYARIIKEARLKITNIDKTAPVVEIVETKHKISNQIEVKGKATDENGEVEKIYFSKNEGTSWEPEGGQRETEYILKKVVANGVAIVKMRGEDIAGNIGETEGTRIRTFEKAIKILEKRLEEVEINEETGIIQLPDGREYKVEINENGGYTVVFESYWSVVEQEEEVEKTNEIIRRIIENEIEKGIKEQIIDWAIEDGITEERLVDREEGTYETKEGEQKKTVVNMGTGEYGTENLTEEEIIEQEIKIKYKLNPSFPILSTEIVMEVIAEYEKGITKIEIISDKEEVLETKTYESGKKGELSYIILLNGEYKIKVTAEDERIAEKQVLIGNISSMYPIKIKVRPQTARNTEKTGIKNGIETGTIRADIKYDETIELENEDKYQYQINSTKGEWQTGTEETVIEDITENCTIYTRYWNGEKGIVLTRKKIDNVDNISPEEFKYEVKEVTSEKIEVEGKTTDRATDSKGNEARLGIAGVLRYEYSIDGENWQKENVFRGLSQKTEYTIYIKAIDKAGNETTTTTTTTDDETVTTKEVEKAEEKVIYEYSTTELTKEAVTVTMRKENVIDETLEIEYQILKTGETEGNLTDDWEKGTNFTITDNCIIYARLVDGEGQANEEGGYAKGEVKNIDNLAPIKPVPVLVDRAETSLTVEADKEGAAKDAPETLGSLSSGIRKYNYYLYKGNELVKEAKEENEYTYKFEGLTIETEYGLIVEAVDNAGNKTASNRVTIKTLDKVPDLQKGENISFIYTPSEWTNREVDIKIETTETVWELLYSIDNGEQWNTYTEQVEIKTNENEKTILARLKDKENGRLGNIYTETVNNIDTIEPNEFIINATEIEDTWVNITASTEDKESTETSGKSGIKHYIYYIKKSTESTYTSSIVEGTSKTYTGLDDETEYSVYVEAYDKAGNKTTSNTIVINTLVTIPDLIENVNVTFTNNPSNWTNGNVNVSITTTETNFILQYSVDNGNSWNNYTQEIVVKENGEKIQVRLEKDKRSGGVATHNVNNIDRIVPIIDSLTTYTTNWTNGNVIITGKATDTLSGIVGYQFSTSSDLTASSSGWTAITATTNQIIKTYTVTRNGTFYFYVKDEVGNINKNSITINNIDTTLPTMGTLIANTTSWTNGNVTITGKATDSLSGIVAYQFSTSESLTASSGGWTNITATTSQITQTYIVSSNGTYYFYVKDVAGNINKNTLRINNIDKTAPTMNSLTASTTGWTSGNVTITGKSTDSLSGIVAYQFSTSESLTASSGGWTNITATTSQITQTYIVSSNGTYYFYVKDQIGNIDKNSIRISNIDKVAPNAFSISSSNITETSFTISRSTTDSLSGVSSYEIYVNNSYYSTGTSVTGRTAGTTYSVYVIAYDRAGNSTRSNNTLSVKTLKKVPNLTSANCTFTYTPSGWTNGTVRVGISTTEKGYTLQYSTNNGSTWSNYTSTISVTKNGQAILARLSDGSRTGGIATGNVTKIDTVSPTTATVSSSNITTTNATITATGADAVATSSSGRSGISRYVFYVDGSIYTTVTTSSSSASMTLAFTANSHNCYIRVYDVAGNYKTSSTITVTRVEQHTHTDSCYSWNDVAGVYRFFRTEGDASVGYSITYFRCSACGHQKVSYINGWSGEFEGLYHCTQRVRGTLICGK